MISDFRVVFLNQIEVRIGHHSKEETQDTIVKLRRLFHVSAEFTWTQLFGNVVNYMHLKIKKLAINGVLRRSMKVELQPRKLGRLNVLVKQVHSLGVHEVSILALAFGA